MKSEAWTNSQRTQQSDVMMTYCGRWGRYTRLNERYCVFVVYDGDQWVKAQSGHNERIVFSQIGSSLSRVGQKRSRVGQYGRSGRGSVRTGLLWYIGTIVGRERAGSIIFEELG